MTTKHSHHHNDQLQLVFISTPGIGNLVPTVEFAQHLLNHHAQFSATILLINMHQRPIVNTYSQSISATATNIRFIHLPTVDPPSHDQFHSSLGYLSLLINNHKPQVKNAIANLIGTQSASESPARVAALFVDMFCTPMIDVANELGVPCYLFFQSPAAFFGFMIDLPDLDPQLVTGFSDSENELLSIRSFANPVPRPVLPNTVLKGKDGYSWYVNHGRRYMETKGIVVNTFRELESYAINSLSSGGVPKVYPIGPVLDLNGPSQWHPDRAHYETVVKWLDSQPTSSVVFLCFGSMGSFTGPQVREIAVGLERAGFRFLWSLRDPPKTQLDLPSDYVDLNEASLPDGFIERTAGTGLVCGWVPQVTVLAHQAIGGFLSHCGWNSILESLWYGVPIATWPIYAEQQLNAFEMVKELGLAVEIRLDYREGRDDLIPAEEVERGIRRLMKGDERVREKVKEMREKSRMTLMENGSSYESLGALVKDLMATN